MFLPNERPMRLSHCQHANVHSFSWLQRKFLNKSEVAIKVTLIFVQLAQHVIIVTGAHVHFPVINNCATQWRQILAP